MPIQDSDEIAADAFASIPAMVAQSLYASGQYAVMAKAGMLNRKEPTEPKPRGVHPIIAKGLRGKTREELPPEMQLVWDQIHAG